MMKKSGRYDTSGMREAQYEPGSKSKVLKNLLTIKTKKEIEQIETKELMRVTNFMIKHYDKDHRFTSEDVCFIHRTWLDSVYEWAGRFRLVSISKGDFLFASPAQIPQLMSEFESNILSRYTPCIFPHKDKTIESLAIVHTEFLLIHPFREGNGRISRLLAALMGLQSGLPFLDFSSIKGEKINEYIMAVQSGLDRNYEPMKKILTMLFPVRCGFMGRNSTAFFGRFYGF